MFAHLKFDHATIDIIISTSMLFLAWLFEAFKRQVFRGDEVTSSDGELFAVVGMPIVFLNMFPLAVCIRQVSIVHDLGTDVGQLVNGYYWFCCLVVVVYACRESIRFAKMEQRRSQRCRTARRSLRHRM